MKLVPLKTYGLGEPTEGPIFQQNCTAVSSYSVGWLTRKVAPASVLKPTIAFLHLHLKRFMQLRSQIISNLLRTGPNPIWFFPNVMSQQHVHQLQSPKLCFLVFLDISRNLCIFLMRPGSITKSISRSTWAKRFWCCLVGQWSGCVKSMLSQLIVWILFLGFSDIQDVPIIICAHMSVHCMLYACIYIYIWAFINVCTRKNTE